VRRTSLVDLLEGVLGEKEFERRTKDEWRSWERDVGIEWDIGLF
jgi:hypothetical protein